MDDEPQPAFKGVEPTAATATKTARLAEVILPLLYALFCAIIILVFSEREYEWMIGQHDLGGPALTLCTIPAPTDDTSDMAIPTLFLIIVLLVPGLMRFIGKRRVGLSQRPSSGLFALWAYRFFIRTTFC